MTAMNRHDLLSLKKEDPTRYAILEEDIIRAYKRQQLVDKAFDMWMDKRKAAFKDTSGYDNNCEEIILMARAGYRSQCSKKEQQE